MFILISLNKYVLFYRSRKEADNLFEKSKI